MKPAADSERADSLSGCQAAGGTVELSEPARAADRLEEPADDAPDRPGARISSAALRETSPPAAVDPAIEPLRQILLREAARFRQHGPGSMAVVVCMDERTELLVHFAPCEGGIDASARCEPADLPRLAALWPRLQQSLAPRRIQLAPLRSASERGSSKALLPGGSAGGRTNAPVARPDWETWA